MDAPSFTAVVQDISQALQKIAEALQTKGRGKKQDIPSVVDMAMAQQNNIGLLMRHFAPKLESPVMTASPAAPSKAKTQRNYNKTKTTADLKAVFDDDGPYHAMKSPISHPSDSLSATESAQVPNKKRKRVATRAGSNSKLEEEEEHDSVELSTSQVTSIASMPEPAKASRKNNKKTTATRAGSKSKLEKEEEEDHEVEQSNSQVIQSPSSTESAASRGKGKAKRPRASKGSEEDIIKRPKKPARSPTPAPSRSQQMDEDDDEPEEDAAAEREEEMPEAAPKSPPHMPAASNVPMVHCSQCSSIFTHKRSLTVHVKKNHPAADHSAPNSPAPASATSINEPPASPTPVRSGAKKSLLKKVTPTPQSPPPASPPRSSEDLLSPKASASSSSKKGGRGRKC